MTKLAPIDPAMSDAARRTLATLEAGGRVRHGDAWDASELAACPTLLEHWQTGQRIRVERTYSDGTVYRRTGRVGKTTGWRPALLLMHRANDVGSSDVLGPMDRVTAVQDRSGRYVPVTR